MSSASNMMEERRKVAFDEAVSMLRAARLVGDELDLRLSQVRRPSYWTEINPRLSIEPTELDFTEPSDSSIEKLSAKFRQEGYLQIGAAVPLDLVGRMREGIETLRSAGWPLVFAFVYDEFWLTTRLSYLPQVFSGMLGDGYKQLPHIWTHRVSPDGGTGWPPHIDGPDKSGRATVWTALSDATLNSGCIYLIPKDVARAGTRENFAIRKTFSSADVKQLLFNSRAIPVAAGTILCWDHNVIHWGSQSRGTHEPRLAISVELIAADQKPDSDDLPLLDAHALPTFSQRLRVIGQALLAYQRFEPLVIRYEELAKELVKPDEL